MSEGISELTPGLVPVGGKSKGGVKRTVAIVRSDVLGNKAVARIGVKTASFISVCRSIDCLNGLAMGGAGLARWSLFSFSWSCFDVLIRLLRCLEPRLAVGTGVSSISSIFASDSSDFLLSVRPCGPLTFRFAAAAYFSLRA